MSNPLILEFAPFTLKPGVSEAQLLAASEHLQTLFLEKQSGYVSRSLVREAEGKFADLIWWTSAEAVKAAMQTAHLNPACAGYFELMQMDGSDPTGGMKHFTSVAQHAVAA